MMTLDTIKRRFRLAVAAAILLAACTGASDHAGAQTPPSAPPRPLVFVPGLMGSQLCRPDPADPRRSVVAWGTLGALPSLSELQLPPDGEDDIRPCGLIRDVVIFGLYTQEVYSPIMGRLERLGYRENHNLFVFDYDWRRSVFDNAQALAAFVRAKVGPDRAVDILAHSMGGLIARVYAMQSSDGRRIARLIAAGTPFLGSAKVFESVDKGWGALNAVMGGIAAFRRTLLSFPSVYELSPRYKECCGAADGAAFSPHDAAAWRALRWDGVETSYMPDLAQTAARAAELQRIVETPLPAGIQDVGVIGVDQRTPHHVVFERTEGTTVARIETNWNGDGTVVRESAELAGAVIHPTSFADHQNILNDAQVQEFLAVALTRGVDAAARSVPVRPRDKMRTFAGVLAELIGVAVAPDQLLYRPGDIGQVRIRFRLDTAEPLSDRVVRLELRAPGAAAQPIALRPDPDASDPANPFEQGFVGRFAAGVHPGPRVLRATVQVEGGRSRVVDKTIAVLSR